MQDKDVLSDEDYQLQLFDNKHLKFNLPSIVKERSETSTGGLTELNVLLLSKQVDTDPSQVLFNQVLDGIILTMTDS